MLPSRVTTSNFQTAGSRNPRAGAPTTTHRLPEEPRVTQPSQPCSEILEIKAGRERKADTSSEEEYFDAGQLSGVWEGLKGLWEDVREGAAAGRLPLPAQGTNMSFPHLTTNGNFSRLWKQSNKNKRNGETEESYEIEKLIWGSGQLSSSSPKATVTADIFHAMAVQLCN